MSNRPSKQSSAAKVSNSQLRCMLPVDHQRNFWELLDNTVEENEKSQEYSGDSSPTNMESTAPQLIDSQFHVDAERTMENDHIKQKILKALTTKEPATEKWHNQDWSLYALPGLGWDPDICNHLNVSRGCLCAYYYLYSTVWTPILMMIILSMWLLRKYIHGNKQPCNCNIEQVCASDDTNDANLYAEECTADCGKPFQQNEQNSDN